MRATYPQLYVQADNTITPKDTKDTKDTRKLNNKIQL